jgi:hypothetical protein
MHCNTVRRIALVLLFALLLRAAVAHRQGHLVPSQGQLMPKSSRWTAKGPRQGADCGVWFPIASTYDWAELGHVAD